MTWPIVLAVLAGAMLHAAWNALIKSAGDKALDTALVHLMGAVVALPLALLIGPPTMAAAPYIAASLVVHVGYYVALAGAYQNGEMGMTYPIMRGTAPLLVAMGSSTVLGEVPTPAAWLGILGVAGGVALVGLAHPGEALHHRKALAFALANAVCIMAYTLIDGLGVRAETRAGGSVWSYLLWLVVLDAFAYPALVWRQRSAEQRRLALTYARGRWPMAALGGTASMGSYSIALWAMTKAPIASVAALRETSVLFAVALSTWLLKERFGVQRALGAAVIVAGVLALRLA